MKQVNRGMLLVAAVIQEDLLCEKVRDCTEKLSVVPLVISNFGQ